MSESYQPKQVLNLNSPHTGDLYVTGNISCGGKSVSNNNEITGNLYVSDSIYTGNLEVNKTAVVTGNLAVGDDLSLMGSVLGDLKIADGNIVPSSSISNTLNVSGNIYSSGYINPKPIAFKVYTTANVTMLNTSDSMLLGTAVGNTFNSYDVNPSGYGGWDYSNGWYKIPLSGYYQFDFCLRALDGTGDYGFEPLLFSNETANYMIATTDHSFWIPLDNTNRRMASYSSCIYCDKGTTAYLTPHNAGTNYPYIEMSGRFIGHK